MTPYQKHKERWKACDLCSLCEGRTKVVLARGTVPCDVLFVGEAPGVSEDIIGKPFVGPAGKMLDQIIKEAMPLTYDDGEDSPPTGYKYDWAFTNLVGCFPKEAKKTNNHEPPEEAIKACAPRLKEMVWVCRPRLIVLVGKLARRYVYGQAQFSNYQDDKSPRFAELPWIPKDKFLEFAEIIHPSAILQAHESQKALLIQRAVDTLTQALEDL